MKRRAIPTAILLIVGALTATPADAAPGSAKTRVAQAAAKYWSAHPGDYVGLETAIIRAGGDSVRFSAAGTNGRGLSGYEMQKLYNRAVRRSKRPKARAAAVPVDAFQVSASWYRVQDTDGEWWNFNGYWNYRDNYIGSGAPDNASGLQVAAMDYRCWQPDGDFFHAASYDNVNYSSRGYRKGVDRDHNVWGVRDGTSGFKLLTDHGQHTYHFKRIASGCTDRPYGKYYWEHNQDGAASAWSFSIDIKIFTISYGGSSGQKLQKYTALVYRP